MAAKKIKATKKIAFNDLVKHLFCIDCKKRISGCVPDSVYLNEYLVEPGMKVKVGIECHVSDDRGTKNAKPRQSRKAV